MAVQNVDIRSAQPALVVALFDPDREVAVKALEVTGIRADLGCDIGFALPALMALTGRADAELSEIAWSALRFAARRHASALRAVRARIEAALGDPNENIRKDARHIIEMIDY